MKLRNVSDAQQKIESRVSLIHPVTGSAQGDTVRALRDRPDLSDDDPCARSPRVAEEDDEDPDHHHGSPTGTDVVRPVVLERRHDTGDDQMAHTHTDGATDQDGLTPKLVNVHDGRESGDPHDNADDAGSQ